MTVQHAMTVSRKRGGGSGRAASSTLSEAARVRLYTLPRRGHSWPYLSAPLPELRKLHTALRRGGVRGVLLDTGAYRLMVSDSCIPGLASADTSSWYWDQYYKRSRSPGEYLSRVAELLSQVAGCNPPAAPLTRWLQAQSRTV